VRVRWLVRGRVGVTVASLDERRDVGRVFLWDDEKELRMLRAWD